MRPPRNSHHKATRTKTRMLVDCQSGAPGARAGPELPGRHLDPPIHESPPYNGDGPANELASTQEIHNFQSRSCLRQALESL